MAQPAGGAKPLNNRVTPLGAVIATAERGLVFGNRGCLHDRQRQIRPITPDGAGSPAGSSSGVGGGRR